MRLICALAAAGGLGVAASAFAGFDHIITFNEVPLGTDANGLEIANARFSFYYDDRGGGAEVGSGPGVTPYTSDPGIEGPTFGTLGIEFKKPVSAFGFGCAFSTFGFVEDALSVEIFDPEGNFLTKIVADASSEGFRGDDGPPPGSYAAGYLLASGYGCIGSAIVNFADFGDESLPRGGQTEIGRFLFDNLGYDLCRQEVIPLPTPAFMGAAGLIGVAAIRRRRGM